MSVLLSNVPKLRELKLRKVEKVENRVESLIQLKRRTSRRKSGDVSGKNTNKTGITEKKRVVKTKQTRQSKKQPGSTPRRYNLVDYKSQNVTLCNS